MGRYLRSVRAIAQHNATVESIARIHVLVTLNMACANVCKLL